MVAAAASRRSVAFPGSRRGRISSENSDQRGTRRSTTAPPCPRSVLVVQVEQRVGGEPVLDHVVAAADLGQLRLGVPAGGLRQRAPEGGGGPRGGQPARGPPPAPG